MGRDLKVVRSPPRRTELDAATLGRAQRGDEAACRELVGCYQDAVFATISRVLGPRGRLALVPDLAQETFLRVFRELAGFRPEAPGRPSSWILTIATRLALDELKRRNLELSPDAATAERVEDEVAASAAAEHHEAAAVLDRALGALPAGWRAVLLLRVVHELPYEEIAARLGLELGTVKSRLARARAALWEALGEGEQR
jgi:RNA polymerase sigma factor (sigma-70 family)